MKSDLIKYVGIERRAHTVHTLRRHVSSLKGTHTNRVELISTKSLWLTTDGNACLQRAYRYGALYVCGHQIPRW